MIEPQRTVLWSSSTVAPNNTSLTLSDSIDNYDEIVCYGSATRSITYAVNVRTEYPVATGEINCVGPFHCGRWGTGDSWFLCDGTQMFISGTSARVCSSYFWGKINGGSAFYSTLATGRVNDVRPYKIEGIKYTTSDDVTLIWSATGNPYNTNITLAEPITNFSQIMVYGSGKENANGTHLSKNIYDTTSSVMGCEPWGYSPWNTGFKCNYALGCDFRLKGNSGHIGSSWYMGMNETSTAWAAGKWSGANVPKMIMPYKVYGLNRK